MRDRPEFDCAYRSRSARFPACVPAVILVVAGLAGCGSIHPSMAELSRNGDTVDLSRMAVVVGSVTQTDPMLPGRNSYIEVRFGFTGPDTDVRFRVTNAQLGLRHLTEPDADRGLEPIHGRLFALLLPPGTYELGKVTLWFQATVEATLSAPPQVTVAAGEVAYVGNLEVKNCYSEYVRPDGQRVRSTVVGGFPTVNDRSHRDLVLLKIGRAHV